MKKIVLSAIIIIVFAWSCTKVPISGRRQLNIYPESEMLSMSLTSYKEFLAKNPPLPDNNKDVALVKKVGGKIAQSVTQFMKQKGLSKRLQGYKWEFNVVNDKTVNAWCMPGGRVVVYTGLLPITQDEGSLAVVMGHEIAHAVARHGNERMSQQIAVGVGAAVLNVGLMNKSDTTRMIFNGIYGAGSTLGILKYSRTHETEADKLGLVFAAMAGYNPQVAVSFWERMAKQGGQKPLELLSTHPSDEKRIKDIKAFLPQAMKYYKPS